MQRKWARLMAVLLVVVLGISLVACADDAAKPDDGTPGGQPTGNVEEPSEGPDDEVVWDAYTPYKETVILTKGVSKPGVEVDYTFESNPFTDYVKEKFNIETKLAWEVDPANYDQKVAMSIVARDIPDIMMVNRKIYLQMLENDLIADMTEAYDKCISPFLREQYDVGGERLFNQVTVDGKLMAIPSPSLSNCHNVLWIRKDWLDALNMQVPKTLEDVIALAKAFAQQDPGENGAGNTVGLTAPDSVYLGYNTWGGLDTMFNALGAYPGAWLWKDDVPVYGSTQPEMKEALTMLRDLYADGTLDKEFAIRKGEDRDALLASGKLGLFFSVWWPAGGLSAAVENDPNADWIAVSAPTNAQGKLMTPENDPLQAILVVRKDYEHPEAVVKALNGGYDILRGNGEGVEANAKWREEYPGIAWGYMPVPMEVNYPDIIGRVMVDIQNAIDAGGDVSVMESVGYSAEVEQIMAWRENPVPENITGYTLDLARLRGVGAAMDSNMELVPVSFHGTTESMSNSWANLQKMETEMMLQIIMGEQPIDSFDTFVSQWHTAGGQTILDEIAAMPR